MGLSDSKSKTNQTQSHNNTSGTTYGWQTPPSSPDLDKLRAAKFTIDPTIPYRSANARNELERGFNSPTGGFYPPNMRDAIVRSGRRRIDQDESQANREGSYDVNRLNYARDAAVAGMSAPVLTQTGATSTGTGTNQGTTVQSQSPWGTIAQVGAAAAPISM